jgi:hypothetical protein
MEFNNKESIMNDKGAIHKKLVIRNLVSVIIGILCVVGFFIFGPTTSALILFCGDWDVITQDDHCVTNLLRGVPFNDAYLNISFGLATMFGVIITALIASTRRVLLACTTFIICAILHIFLKSSFQGFIVLYGFGPPIIALIIIYLISTRYKNVSV